MAYNLEAERLWKRVKRLGPDDCWEWQGARDRNGYGKLGINYRSWLAHRLSWAVENGSPAPDGAVVCHKCDNPACVNPRHLWLGSQRDNLRDMFAKGRGKHVVSRDNRGERNPRAKLTNQAVEDIRALGGTMPQREIAARFGIGRDQVSRILSGARWRHGS